MNKSIRTFALAMLVLVGTSTVKGQIPLPLYEPFPASYTNTSDGTTQVPAGGTSYPFRNLRNTPTTTVWAIGGSAGGGSPVVVGGAAALSYPGLYQQPGTIGLFIRTNNTTATRSAGILYTTVAEGKMYASFLMNVQSSPLETDPAGPNRLFAKLDSAITGTGGSAMAGVWLTSSNTLAISKGSNSLPAADTGVQVGTNLTHLIVIRYTFNPDVNDDEVALWVDPAGTTFDAPEASVPAPLITTTSGADVASFSSFYIYHIGSEVVASMFLDEVRLGTAWAQVVSSQPLCVAASISQSPTNQTVSEGIGVTLTCIAGGSTPAFQWQVSTNGALEWKNVSGGVGGTSQTFLTAPTTPANNGDQYRVVANVACGGGSSATSQVATVTVANAVATSKGVVVDDKFQDYLYNNLPYDLTNSVWFAGVAGSLDASSGQSMIATPQSGSANWVGYFTDDSVTNLPVHLAVGRALKGTLIFNGTDIVTNNGGLRIGFFDYADGSTRLTADGYGNTMRGQNVRGYMVALNYGLTYSGNPFSFYARNNLGSGDLMGTVNDYLGLGGGPSGFIGAPAYENSVNYTLEFTLARKALNSVALTAKVTGGGTNWTYTRTDTTYAYPRFDCIALRATSAAQTASRFEISRLLVEVVDSPPDPVPLTATVANGTVTLTWNDPSFKLQAAPAVDAAFATLPQATSPYTVPGGGPRQFYRLIWTP